MAFSTIGFQAALILNRLRNQRLIEEVDREYTEHRQAQKREEEAVRAQLALVNERLRRLTERDKKLAAEAARVEPNIVKGGDTSG
ncbi:hypothetical protein [Bradyrhizobium sp. Leo121]|uniref:hypothetical protein n=1 Tax=Bradyrhizobium sp. Leo121 TaxID=1571195 RepID=UPI001028CF73|nr:hypothetical protein [Bradyrhizobium sp. Leo121]